MGDETSRPLTHRPALPHVERAQVLPVSRTPAANHFCSQPQILSESVAAASSVSAHPQRDVPDFDQNQNGQTRLAKPLPAADDAAGLGVVILLRAAPGGVAPAAAGRPWGRPG